MSKTKGETDLENSLDHLEKAETAEEATNAGREAELEQAADRVEKVAGKLDEQAGTPAVPAPDPVPVANPDPGNTTGSN